MNNLNWPFIISKFILEFFFINSNSYITLLDSRYNTDNINSVSNDDKIYNGILMVFFATNNNLYRIY